MPADRAEGAGRGRDEYCLWGCNTHLLPGHGQYQYELKYCACLWFALAFHQLWRKWFDRTDARCRAGGECCHAPQAAGVLKIRVFNLHVSAGQTCSLTLTNGRSEEHTSELQSRR